MVARPVVIGTRSRAFIGWPSDSGSARAASEPLNGRGARQRPDRSQQRRSRPDCERLSLTAEVDPARRVIRDQPVRAASLQGCEPAERRVWASRRLHSVPVGGPPRIPSSASRSAPPVVGTKHLVVRLPLPRKLTAARSQSPSAKSSSLNARTSRKSSDVPSP